MSIDIKLLGAKQSDIAFIYSTKERPDYTRQTLPKILSENGDFDVYWLDGSAPDSPNRNLWNDPQFKGLSKLKEVHLDVTGGPDAAIRYGLATLFSKGYDHIGLIENDVLLTCGWFKRIMQLFNCDTGRVFNNTSSGEVEEVVKLTQGKTPGAVSARTFKDRILQRHDGFAEMANVGAGMILFKRDVIEPILYNYRKAAVWEVRAICKALTGMPYPLPKQITEQDPKLEKQWHFSCDWYFEPVVWSCGYCVLAPIPSMAMNLDDPQGARDPVETGQLAERVNAE